MSKGEQTREMIIRQAVGVFNRFGYFGTSISDIMRETGLQKGGIYNHFADKDELALASFDYAVSITADRLVEAFKEIRNAADRLIIFTEVFADRMDDEILPGGCPVMNTAIEADDAHPALRDRAKGAMTDMRDTLIRIVNKGIERGEIKADTNPQNAATILISMLEGALMMSKLYGDENYMTQATEHVRQYIERELRA